MALIFYTNLLKVKSLAPTPIFLYLLKLIGKKRIGNRPERIEPRAIKKRHNDYPLLMKPRNIAREEIQRNGHPKKLK